MMCVEWQAHRRLRLKAVPIDIPDKKQGGIWWLSKLS
jgi:hypothetical protein